MRRASRRLDAWLVMLGSTSLVAWSLVALDGSHLTLPDFCSAGTVSAAALPVSFGFALLFNSALMVAAMMSPLVIAPLRHVRDRSFARRRARAMLLFSAGYMAVWMAAGVGLQAMARTARWAAPAPLACLGLAAAIASLWQVSPAKQWCLNRCHIRPNLAAFGAAADRDAFNFGLKNGASCAGACWPLMLLALLVEHGHAWGMIAVTLFVFAERLERPAPLAWRWRGPGKAVRVTLYLASIVLQPGIREAR